MSANVTPRQNTKGGIEPHDAIRGGAERDHPPDEVALGHEPGIRQYLDHQLVTVHNGLQGPPFIHVRHRIEAVMRLPKYDDRPLASVVLPELGSPTMWTLIIGCK